MIEDAMRRDTAGPLGICRVCLPWGLRGGVLSRILFLIACRLSKAQEQFWEICLGGGGGQLPSIFGEACPGGRQLSPIFWQRICRGGRAAIANFGRGVPLGKAATNANFLAGNLPRLPLAKAG